MPSDKYRHWFDTGDGMGRVTDNNRATFFTTGEDAFADIGETLEYGASRRAEAYFLGWCFYRDTPLRPKDPLPLRSLSTVTEHLRYFDAMGGSVRAMLWDNNLLKNAGTVDGVHFIRGLSQGAAILDRRTPLAGTHHQKIQAVVAGPDSKTPGAATAYCGGMEMSKDRIGRDALHDVHCKVTGDGANELINVFTERWNDHPDHGTDLAPSYLSLGPRNGKDLVQVCRTYPRFSAGELSLYTLLKEYRSSLDRILESAHRPYGGDMSVKGETRLYNFYDTSKGVQQIGRAVNKAITEAKKYIYLEDQYLVHKWIGQILAKKLADSDKNFRIVIVIPHPDVADLAQSWHRIRDVTDQLNNVDFAQQKWRIFIRSLDRPHSYVHSKTWIFDDELVITGSANADRRGYTYSSEADVAVAGDLTGARRSSYGATTVAQDLRCRLFAKHLGQRPHFYLNPKHGIAQWFGSVRNTNVTFFNPWATYKNVDENVDKLLATSMENTAAGTAAAAVVRIMEGQSGSVENFLWDYIEDPHPDVPNP